MNKHLLSVHYVPATLLRATGTSDEHFSTPDKSHQVPEPWSTIGKVINVQKLAFKTGRKRILKGAVHTGNIKARPSEGWPGAEGTSQVAHFADGSPSLLFCLSS